MEICQNFQNKPDILFKETIILFSKSVEYGARSNSCRNYEKDRLYHYNHCAKGYRLRLRLAGHSYGLELNPSEMSDSNGMMCIVLNFCDNRSKPLAIEGGKSDWTWKRKGELRKSGLCPILAALQGNAVFVCILNIHPEKKCTVSHLSSGIAKTRQLNKPTLF